jgi:hypothetical protein
MGSPMCRCTLDNARWFGRLRSLGAEEERGASPAILHDRLGQWLTYIKLRARAHHQHR